MGFTEKYVVPVLHESGLELTVAVAVVLFAWIILKKWKVIGPSGGTKDDLPNYSLGKSRKDEQKQNIENDPTNDESDEEDLSGLVPPLHSHDLQHVPLHFVRMSEELSLERSRSFYECMNARRSVRYFSREPVAKHIIENIIRTAGTAPSGAHTEPWSFVAIRDPDIKAKVREIVEEEEEINYRKRMGAQWTSDLAAIRTTWVKEYLTEAPWLVIIFKQVYTPLPDGRKRTNYYHEISTSLASGVMLAAIQYSGLVTLTSTPLNCGPALKTLLDRPPYEKLLMLLPIGYPAANATVPDFSRKSLDEIMVLI